MSETTASQAEQQDVAPPTSSDTPPADLVPGKNQQVVRTREGQWRLMPIGRLGGFGRQKGVVNRSTVEMKSALRRFLEDDDYQQNLMMRIEAGAAPIMEKYLWELVYGKPKIVIETESPQTLPLDGAIKLMSRSEQLMIYTMLKKMRRLGALAAVSQVIPIEGKVLSRVQRKAKKPKPSK